MEKLKENRSVGGYIGFTIAVKLMPILLTVFFFKKNFSGFREFAVGSLFGFLGGGFERLVQEALTFLAVAVVCFLAYAVYVLVLFWGVCRDINTICARCQIPGNSPVYLLVALLSAVTLQGYHVFWSYQQGRRLEEASGRLKRPIGASGSSHLALSLLGAVPVWLNIVFFVLLRTKPSFLAAHWMWAVVGVIVGFALSFIGMVNMAGFIRDVNVLAKACMGQPAEPVMQPMIRQPDAMQAADDDKTMPVQEWAPDAKSAWTPQGESEQPGGCIECCRGMYEGAVFPLEGEELVIGRDETCAHIVIKNPEISRKHCGIRYHPNSRGYLVTDYSSNGVYYKNGQAFPKKAAVSCSPGTILVIARSGNEFLLK